MNNFPRLRRAALRAPHAKAIEPINDYLFVCDSVNRGPEMLTLLAGSSRRPAAVFWPVVMYNWSICDLINFEGHLWRKTLAYYKRKADPVQFMESEMRAYYDALPGKLTIYRGSDRPFIDGLAWTLDKRVAEAFARGFRFMNNKNPVIATAEVCKHEIYFATNDREESEVVTAVERIEVEERPDLRRVA